MSEHLKDGRERARWLSGRRLRQQALRQEASRGLTKASAAGGGFVWEVCREGEDRGVRSDAGVLGGTGPCSSR